jgi:hypothetical protein
MAIFEVVELSNVISSPVIREQGYQSSSLTFEYSDGLLMLSIRAVISIRNTWLAYW